MTKPTDRKAFNRLHVLALLGAVTGSVMITAGPAAADSSRWSCDDALPGHGTHAGSRCSYDAFPVGPRPAANRSGPSPTPPYTP